MKIYTKTDGNSQNDGHTQVQNKGDVQTEECERRQRERIRLRRGSVSTIRTLLGLYRWIRRLACRIDAGATENEISAGRV